jgi:hypothetical protein
VHLEIGRQLADQRHPELVGRSGAQQQSRHDPVARGRVIAVSIRSVLRTYDPFFGTGGPLAARWRLASLAA